VIRTVLKAAIFYITACQIGRQRDQRLAVCSFAASDRRKRPPAGVAGGRTVNFPQGVETHLKQVVTDAGRQSERVSLRWRPPLRPLWKHSARVARRSARPGRCGHCILNPDVRQGPSIRRSSWSRRSFPPVFQVSGSIGLPCKSVGLPNCPLRPASAQGLWVRPRNQGLQYNHQANQNDHYRSSMCTGSRLNLDTNNRLQFGDFSGQSAGRQSTTAPTSL